MSREGLIFYQTVTKGIKCDHPLFASLFYYIVFYSSIRDRLHRMRTYIKQGKTTLYAIDSTLFYYMRWTVTYANAIVSIIQYYIAIKRKEQ